MRFKKKSCFFLFISGEEKFHWKNCLKVQEHAYRRVMDMDRVSISCQNEQGWFINHFQHVLALLLCFITPVFPDSIDAAILFAQMNRNWRRGFHVDTFLHCLVRLVHCCGLWSSCKVGYFLFFFLPSWQCIKFWHEFG